MATQSDPNRVQTGSTLQRSSTAAVVTAVLRDARETLTDDQLDEVVGTAFGRWPHGGHIYAAERALTDAARCIDTIADKRRPFASVPAGERGTVTFRLPALTEPRWRPGLPRLGDAFHIEVGVPDDAFVYERATPGEGTDEWTARHFRYADMVGGLVRDALERHRERWGAPRSSVALDLAPAAGLTLDELQARASVAALAATGA